jgi:transcriptional regulator with XRE-family HTH domain
MSQGEVAKELGVSSSAVNRYAKEKSIDPMFVAPARAISTKRQYDVAGRTEVSNEFFDKIREKLQDPSITATDLKNLALAFGITTDKRRLDDGESTNRSETVSTKSFDLEAEFQKLDATLASGEGSPSTNGSTSDA